MSLYINGNKVVNSLVIDGKTHFTDVLTAGVVSTDSAYATATFNDISNYKYVLVKVYDTVSGVDYSDVIMFDVSKVVSAQSFDFTLILHNSVKFTITPTSIKAKQYSGDYYYYIYADVCVTNNEIFS